MTVDFQIAFNALMAIGAVVVPFAIRSITDRINEAKSAAGAAVVKADAAERALLEYKAHVAESYPSRDTLRDMLQPIMDELQKIDRKLDGKQDRA